MAKNMVNRFDGSRGIGWPVSVLDGRCRALRNSSSSSLETSSRDNAVGCNIVIKEARLTYQASMHPFLGKFVIALDVGGDYERARTHPASRHYEIIVAGSPPQPTPRT